MSTQMRVNEEKELAKFVLEAGVIRRMGELFGFIGFKGWVGGKWK